MPSGTGNPSLIPSILETRLPDPVVSNLDVDVSTVAEDVNSVNVHLRPPPPLGTKFGFRKGMVIASLNINSLPAHTDEIKVLLQEQNIHILALNETKIDADFPSEQLKVQGYQFDKYDRNRDGGGVAFYIRDSLEVDIREDLPVSSLELRCIEVKPVRAKPFFVVSWYRPPSDLTEIFDKFEEVLKFLESEGKEIILLGDTNCDVTSIYSPQIDSNQSLPNSTKHILDLYNSFGLKQLISEPTRETIDTSSIIDHIAVSNHFNVVESGVLKTSISDYYLVYVCRKFRGSLSAKHKVITSRQMKNFDKDLFLSDLASVDWSAIVYNSDDVDSAVCQWSRTLSDIIEKHAPLRERRVTERFSPWITAGLKRLLRARDKLKIKAVKVKSQLLMNAYKQMRCKANNLNRKLKREHFSSKIELNKGNIKETWRTINQLVNKRSKTTEISTIREGDRVISDPTEIADSMNQFFCSVGKDLSDKIPNKENPLLTGNYGERKKDVEKFAFIPVNPENVMKGCKDFKTFNSYGTDFISVFFLKVGIEVLAPSLAQLFNLSLSTGRFPDS